MSITFDPIQRMHTCRVPCSTDTHSSLQNPAIKQTAAKTDLFAVALLATISIGTLACIAGMPEVAIILGVVFCITTLLMLDSNAPRIYHNPPLYVPPRQQVVFTPDRHVIPGPALRQPQVVHVQPRPAAEFARVGERSGGQPAPQPQRARTPSPDRHVIPGPALRQPQVVHVQPQPAQEFGQVGGRSGGRPTPQPQPQAARDLRREDRGFAGVGGRSGR